MELAYGVVGRYKGEKWRSEIFEDVQDAFEELLKCSKEPDYTELEQCNVYIHFEPLEKAW